MAAALMRGETIIIDDVRSHEPMAVDYRAIIQAVGAPDRPPFNVIRSWMAVPLTLKERVLGALTISWTEPSYFTAEHARLARAFADQVAIAIENARLYEEAQQAASLEERQRLARELHDSVSQALYGIALGARTARELIDRDPARATEPIDYVLSLAEAGLTEMRALIFELRPESLETEGLVVALQKQVAATRARHGLAVDEALGDEPEAPLPVKEALYRIAQEALHNVVKHARAGRVQLRLASIGGALELEVVDDGIGFDPDADYAGHLGLRSMRERAARLGGEVTIDSTAEGTRLRARLPVAAAAYGTTGTASAAQ
jgi:signal transduction histidine kinase